VDYTFSRVLHIAVWRLHGVLRISVFAHFRVFVFPCLRISVFSCLRICVFACLCVCVCVGVAGCGEKRVPRIGFGATIGRSYHFELPGVHNNVSSKMCFNNNFKVIYMFLCIVLCKFTCFCVMFYPLRGGKTIFLYFSTIPRRGRKFVFSFF
jgi:hypothetical protein